MQVKKPWGYYEDYVREQDFVLKKIVIFSDESISLQKHEYRSEDWFIRDGYYTLQVNGTVFTRSGPCKITIQPGEIHRIENLGEDNLEIYEIQTGFCSEDDIVRLEDKYGRPSK